MEHSVTVIGFFNEDADQECFIKIMNEEDIIINGDVPKKDFGFIYNGFHAIPL